MKEKDVAIDLEKMHNPSYKLLVTTAMAAIMFSGKDSREWSDLLKSIAPIYSSIAKDTQGEVKEALLTVSHILQDGDAFVGNYFDKDSLNFDHMVEVSATGADFWMCKLSDGEIAKNDLIKLFEALKAGLVATVGELRDENEMINQLIQVQDKVIEHVLSLN